MRTHTQITEETRNATIYCFHHLMLSKYKLHSKKNIKNELTGVVKKFYNLKPNDN